MIATHSSSMKHRHEIRTVTFKRVPSANIPGTAQITHIKTLPWSFGLWLQFFKNYYKVKVFVVTLFFLNQSPLVLLQAHHWGSSLRWAVRNHICGQTLPPHPRHTSPFLLCDFPQAPWTKRIHMLQELHTTCQLLLTLWYVWKFLLIKCRKLI